MGRITLLGAGKPPVAAAGGGGWTSPLDASTPAVWWIDLSYAPSVTTDGGTPNHITALADRGTGGHNMVSGAGVGPEYMAAALNGKPGMYLGNSLELHTTVAFALAQPFMVVCVFKRQTGYPTYGGYNIIWDGEVPQANAGRPIVLSCRPDQSNSFCVQAGTIVSQGVPLAENTAYHSRTVFNGASSRSVLNGSDLNPVTMGTTGIINGITLASGQVDLCEAFVIPNPIAADHTNAAAYTLAKWGV